MLSSLILSKDNYYEYCIKSINLTYSLCSEDSELNKIKFKFENLELFYKKSFKKHK